MQLTLIAVSLLALCSGITAQRVGGGRNLRTCVDANRNCASFVARRNFCVSTDFTISQKLLFCCATCRPVLFPRRTSTRRATTTVSTTTRATTPAQPIEEAKTTVELAPPTPAAPTTVEQVQAEPSPSPTPSLASSSIPPTAPSATAPAN